MRIVMGAQSCGFGPVAKLVAIAGLLPEHDKLFIGDDIALTFAQTHPEAFSEIVACEPEELASVQPLIEGCDLGVIAMHHELAFWVVKSGRPLYFFDSLLGFWVLDHDLATLAEAAAQIRAHETGAAYELFHSFSVHERKVICHLLATRSFAQNFVGVAQRVAELHKLGARHVSITGSMIDIGQAQLDAPDEPAAGWEMVINLGGIKNFILNFNDNDYYIDLIEGWARHFLRAHPDCGRIIVCCGRNVEPQTEQIGRSWLERRFLPHDRFTQVVRRARVYVSSPGLTAINEAAQLGQAPVLLPEQHASQLYNLYALRSSRLGRWSVGLADLFEPYEVPEEDYAGSAAIIDYTRRVYTTPALSERLYQLLDECVESVLASTAAARRQALDELRGLLAGPSLAEAVGEMLDDAGQASIKDR